MPYIHTLIMIWLTFSKCNEVKQLWIAFNGCKILRICGFGNVKHLNSLVSIHASRANHFVAVWLDCLINLQGADI